MCLRVCLCGDCEVSCAGRVCVCVCGDCEVSCAGRVCVFVCVCVW